MLLGSVAADGGTTHGLGLRATAPVPAGTVVWFPCPQCPTYTPDQLGLLPPDVVDRLDTWGHLLSDARMLVPCAGAYLMNHSCTPSVLDFGLDFGVAVVDIPAGAEVTCDYGTFNGDPESWSMDCVCGSPSCRGEVGTVDHADPAVRASWVERIEAVLPAVRAVPQPLGRLLSTHSAAYRSVLDGLSSVDGAGDSVVRPGFLGVSV